MQYVFVLNKNKKPLNPCHPAAARKLLKQGKAVVHKRNPFTIRLKEKVENPDNKEFTLKVDPGSKTTGLAILQEDVVLFLFELYYKTIIKKKMTDRKGHRVFRRGKKRYRKCRPNNRKREEGWLAPSLQARVDCLESFVKRLMRLINITKIMYENVKFDTQLMDNPNIRKWEYSQGTLEGYNIREYLLEIYNRTCQYCRITNVPMEVEHIIPKSRGGSNRIDNLTIACRSCNQEKDNLTAEEFGFSHIQKGVKPSLKDTAFMNSTRNKMKRVLEKTGLILEYATGAQTKKNRLERNLPKEHYYDAVCVGEMPEKLMFKTDKVLEVKASGRGSYQRTNLDRYGFPIGYYARQKMFYGFMSGDYVRADVPLKLKTGGTHFGHVGCRKTGSFDIRTSKGRVSGINYKYIKLLERADGYSYNLKTRNVKLC
jgi:5-methylcytosine-specific restriction endonuclease McrA